MPVIEVAAPQAAPPASGGPVPATVEASGSLGGQVETKGASFGEKLARLAKIESAQSDPDPGSLGEEMAAALLVLPFVAGGGPSPVAFDGATGTRTPPVPTFLAVTTQGLTVTLPGPTGKGPSIIPKVAGPTLVGNIEPSLLPNVQADSARSPVWGGEMNGISKEETGAVQGLGASLPAPTRSSSPILASFPITGAGQNLAAAGVRSQQESGGAPTAPSGMTSLPAPEGPSSGVLASMPSGIGMDEGILAGSPRPQANWNESVPLVAPHVPAGSNGGPALPPGVVRVDGVGAEPTGAIAGEALTKVMEDAATHDWGNQAAHNGGESAGSPGTHSHAAELFGKPVETTVTPEATPTVPKVTPASPETAPVVPAHGRETMQLLFEPADLGRVRMQISILAHEVHATVSVQHQGLGEYLTNSQGALDDQLRQHGLRVEEFQVNTNPGRAGHGQDLTQFQGRENAETVPRPEPAESPALMRDAVEGESESLTSLLRINTFA